MKLKSTPSSDVLFTTFTDVEALSIAVAPTFALLSISVVDGTSVVRQVQFLCHKMNHLSVDEKFSMRAPKVTKKFRFLFVIICSRSHPSSLSDVFSDIVALLLQTFVTRLLTRDKVFHQRHAPR